MSDMPSLNIIVAVAEGRRLYAAGALLVSRSAFAMGCFSWLRPVAAASRDIQTAGSRPIRRTGPPSPF